jgi:hypothetical protein
MRCIYQLQICFDPSLETYDAITTALSKFPKIGNHSQSIPTCWIYEVIVEEIDPYFDFIHEFLNILENNYVKLSKAGVEKESISIWLYYEYDSQCNMEFDPVRLKRLGENGITLCISCWDSGDTYNNTKA